MPPEDETESNEVDEADGIKPVEKSKEFVERHVSEALVIEMEDNVIIDFQELNAHVLLDESGDPSQFGGELESSVRIHLSLDTVEKLATNLSQYAEESQKAFTEESQ